LLAGLEDLTVVQRTLARALAAMPPEALFKEKATGDLPEAPETLPDIFNFLAARGRSRRKASGPLPRGSSRTMKGDRVPTDEFVSADAGQGPSYLATTTTTTGTGTGGAVAERQQVIPERVDRVMPGLPDEAATLELSVAEPDFVSTAVSGAGGGFAGSAGQAPALTGLISPDSTVPSYHGMMPLVSPAVSAVASRAMLSERREGGTRPGPAPSGTEDARGRESGRGQTIDMDALAMEMAERIIRRLKREKERRGLYG